MAAASSYSGKPSPGLELSGAPPPPHSENEIPNPTYVGPVTGTSYQPVQNPQRMQIGRLLVRIFMSILREELLLRLCSHVVVGLLIAFLYYDSGSDASKVLSNAVCIFFTVMSTTVTTMMPTIQTFSMELLNHGCSLEGLYFTKTILDLPFQIAFSSVYAIIVYYMTSQPMETNRVLMFTFINFITGLVAQSIGLLIGAVTKKETGLYIGASITVPIALVSGLFVDFETTPFYVKWLSHLSYIKYGFEGAMLSIYGYGREMLYCPYIYCQFKRPDTVLKEMKIHTTDFWTDVRELTAFFIIMRIATYLVLRCKLRKTL